jgi:chromosome segregation ATPase
MAQIDNPLVLQTLINSFSIESTIMVEARVTGEKIMRTWPAKVKNCFDRDGNRIGSRSGGNANFYMGKKSSVGGFAMLTAPQDYDSQINTLWDEMNDLKRRLEQAKRAHTEANEAHNSAKDTQLKLTVQVRNVSKQLHGLERSVLKLKEELEEMESDNGNNLVGQLLEERRSLEERKETLAKQFQPLTELRERILESLRRVKVCWFILDFNLFGCVPGGR